MRRCPRAGLVGGARRVLVERTPLRGGTLAGNALGFGVYRGARLRFALELLLGSGALPRRLERCLVGGGTRLCRVARALFRGNAAAGQLGRLGLERAPLLGERGRGGLGFAAQPCLLERRALGLGPLAREPPGFGLRRDFLFCLAAQLLFRRLLLARRFQRARLGLHALAHGTPALFFRRRALAHRRRRLHLGLGAIPGVRRGLHLFLPPALGEGGGLLLRILAAFRLGDRPCLYTFALSHQA